MTTTREMHVLLAALALLPAALLGGGTTQANPPECDKNSEDCGCKDKKKEITANCIKVDLDLGETTPWTGSLECSLKVFADGGSWSESREIPQRES